MKRPAFRVSAVSLLEESFDLLRGCPPGILLRYYVGALPFVLACCAFVLDLSRNPAAGRRSGAWALLMVALYCWLKLWHAGFARGLRAELGDDAVPRDERRLVRDANYLGWQGLGPWLLTVAAIATVPFGWIYAFLHALSVTGSAERAWRQARDWPRQNHVLVSILFLLGCVVMLNVVAAVLMLPALFDSLLGIETAASHDPRSLLSSTLLVVSLAAAYLLVGPVAKAAYVLRAYYGDARVTGEDLKSRLRALSTRASALLACLMVGAVALGAAGSPTPAVDTAALDRALDHELTHADYDWLRLEEGPDSQQGFVGRLMERALDGLETVFDRLGDLIDKIIVWLRDGRDTAPDQRGREGFALLNPRLLIVLATLAVLVGLFLVLMRRDGGKPEPVAVGPEAAEIEAALAGDDAAADSMPYDEWLEKARQLLATGDGRQAARALYLATLSFLAHAELLLLARHKSNRDYEAELEIKSRRWPDLEPTFADSVRVIERVWYGRHAAGRPEIDRLSGNLEAMRGLHEAG